MMTAFIYVTMTLVSVAALCASAAACVRTLEGYKIGRRAAEGMSFLYGSVIDDIESMERRIASLERGSSGTGRFATLDRDLSAAEEATNVYIDDFLQGQRK